MHLVSWSSRLNQEGNQKYTLLEAGHESPPLLLGLVLSTPSSNFSVVYYSLFLQLRGQKACLGRIEQGKNGAMSSNFVSTHEGSGSKPDIVRKLGLEIQLFG